MSKENKVDIENLNKESRVILFLKEIKDNMSKEEIENLYLEKYNLSEKSNKINLRVLERSLFIKNRNLKDNELIENKKVLINNLESLKIDYLDLVNKFKIVKENIKNNNKLKNNFRDLESLKELFN